MLTNIHSQGGVVLQIFRLPPSGKGQCRIAQSHRLPSSVKKATGLAVVNLTPPPTADGEQGYTQFVIAVAGHDISISLFKVDLQHEANNYLVTPIKPFRKFKNVHPGVITGITFSTFTPPTQSVTASTPPQHLKLASTGISNTVIVHTLPLFPVPLSVKRGQSSIPRYVGVVEPHLGAAKYLPVPLQEAIGKPYTFPSNYHALNTHTPSALTSTIPSDSPSSSTPDFFASLRSPSPNSAPPKIYLHHGPPVPDIENQDISPDITSPELSSSIKAVFHDEEKHEGKSWDELTAPQKENWKRKLKDAGHWAEEMGEKVSRGWFLVNWEVWWERLLCRPRDRRSFQEGAITRSENWKKQRIKDWR
ncbi:hypothetical protein H4I96_02698 [Botrytis cinerea]